MKNLYTEFFTLLQKRMSQFVLAIVLLVCSATLVNAQTPPYQILFNAANTSTVSPTSPPSVGGNSFPFQTNQKGVQWLVRPGEFALPSAAPSGNNITEIWFYLNANTTTLTTFEIKLGQLSDVTHSAWTPTTIYTGSMTSVYTAASLTFTMTSAGWKSFTLSSPFAYDPSQALIVYVSQCGQSAAGMTINQNAMLTTPRRKYLTPTSCVQAYTGQDATLPGIGLTLVPSTPCTGVPVPGNTLSTANPVCPAQNFTLSTQFGGAIGANITYQWQSSPDNVTWTNISGATNSTYATTQSTPTYYYCNVTCTNSSQSALSSSLLVGSLSGVACLNYCTSIPTQTIDEEIYSITVNGASTPATYAGCSGCAVGSLNCASAGGNVAPGAGSILSRYSNFFPLGALTTIVPGTTVNFTIEENECDGATFFANGIGMWIDFNQNGSFTDAGEAVYIEATTVTSPQTINGSFTVPIGATAGITGMRVIAAEGQSGALLVPCLSYSYGETEDWLINIAALTPCAGTPAPGNTMASANNICPFAVFNLSLQNIATLGSGITYQWQSSPNGSTWTNVGGATSNTYSPSISTTTWYQCIVTCTNSSSSNNSTPVQVVVNGTPLSGSYTINSAVATGGTNYQTFTAFAADLVCKGVSGPVVANVNATSGPYNEQVNFPQITGMSATNTVTINGNNRTITYGAGTTAAPHVFMLSGADFFTVNNMIMSGTNATNGLVCHLWNGANNNTFNNCTFQVNSNNTSSVNVPVSISASATSAGTSGTPVSINNVFDGCIMKNGYYNVALVGNSAAPTTMTGTQIKNCTIQDHYLYGIYNVYHTGTVLSNNIIERPVRTTHTTSYGIYLSSSITNLLCEKNRIRNPFGGIPTSASIFYGIYGPLAGTSGNENKYINNVLSDFNSNGQFYGMYLASANFTKVYHNTIFINHAASTYTGITYGIYTTATTSFDLRNNIIDIRRGGTGTKYCIAIATTAPSIVCNNNDLYYLQIAGVNYIGQYISTNYATLATWQAGSAKDANSASIDPAYINPAGGDFTPGISAVAINDIGANVGVLTDITGASRNVATPDPGAFEFSVTACTNPPTPGTAVSSAGNICAGVAFTLSLSGATSGSGQTHQWQSSPDNVTWTNIGGATASGYSTTQTVNTYYRCVLTCGASATSTSVLVTTPALLSGTFTINSAVATGGTNFQSFTAAASALACGIGGPVVFNVVAGSGPYTEQIIAPAVFGTSAVNTITVNGNNCTLQFNSTNTAFPSVLELAGLDYLIVNNLIFSQTSTTISAFAVHLWNGSDNNQFNGCTMMTPANATLTNVPFSISASATSATTTGIPVSINNKLDGCTVKNGYYNIVLYGYSTTPSLMTGTQILNCTIQDQYVYGIYSLYNRGTIISGNTIERPTRTTVSTFYGIYLSSSMDGMLVEKNRIRNPFGAAPGNANAAYCIYSFVTGVSGFENRIQNNLISDIVTNGQVYGIYNSSGSFTKIYHNTVSLTNTASTYTGTIYGLYNGGTTGTDIRNNIIHLSLGGTGIKYNIYMGAAAAICNYNDLYNAGTVGTNYIGSYLSVNYSTLATWQATPYDLNSVGADPVYTDAPAGDYQPTVVTLDNVATPVGVTTDINGLARSATTPDIGAWEYTLSATDIGATLLVTPAIGECMTSTQSVVVRVKNKGTAVLNFSVNPATISCNVTGMATATLSATINSGTLAVGATMDVTLSPTFDMSTTGNYNFAISATVSGDGNTVNDAIASVSRTKVFTAGSISSAVTSVCFSAPPTTLTLAGATGGSIQWQMSTVSSSGPWTNVGTGLTTYSPPNANGTAWYNVLYTCEASSATSNTLLITVNNPEILTTAPATRCGAGTVALGATAAAGLSINWYNTPTGGVSIGTGGSFTTPLITSNTTYYAEAGTGVGIQSGLGSNVIPTASGFNAKRGIQFDATTQFTLETAQFYAAFAGTTSITVELQNSAGTVLQTANVTDVSASATPGWHTMNINFLINPGTGYKLLAQFNSGSLSNYSHSSGANYAISPWNNLGSVGVITSGLDFGPVVSPTTYWYFYNIQISAGCTGARVPVQATVTASTPISLATSTPLVCVGTSATVSVSSSNANYNYTWSSIPAGFTATGPGPHSVTPGGTGATYIVYGLDNSTNCGAFDSAHITTLTNPITLTTSSTPSAVCPGGSTQLNATASAGGASSYCIPAYANYDGTDYVSNVTLNTINNTTGATALPGYVDYSSTISTTLVAGNSYTIYVTDGSFSSGENMAAWIDYNQNNVFDATEQVLPNSVTVVAFETFFASFTVPASAINGATRLRVMDMYSITANPCATGSTYGETEDYTIIISGGIPNNNVSFTYSWSPATYLNNPNIANPVASNVTSAVTYSVVVSLPGSGCTSSSTANFTMNPPPQPSAFSNSPICDGSTLTFFGDNTASGQSTGNTYLWSGPSFSSTLQNPSISGATTAVSGTYTLTVTNSYGCTETTTYAAIINPNPVISIATQTDASCPGSMDGCIDIDANNGTPLYLFDLDGNATLDGNYCGLGAGTYTANVIDDNGCEAATALITLTDVDITPPVITVPAIDRIVECDGAGNAADWNDWLITNWGDADATDNCTPTSYLDLYWVNTYDVNNWVTDCGNTKHINVGFAVYDQAGNYSDTTYATFYIVDTTDPLITFTPPAINTVVDPGLCTTVPSLGSATAIDDCAGAGLIITNDAPAGGVFGVGVTTVTWTATDQCGNSSTSTTTVTVIDNQNPNITCPPDVIVNANTGVCYATLTLSTPVTGDNCGVIGVTNNAPAQFPVGATIVDWEVEDLNGNKTGCQQFVIVVDNQNPVISGMPSNITFTADPTDCNPAITWTAPTAADNCSVASFTSTSNPGDNFAEGTTTVTYTAIDINGNQTQASFTVTILTQPLAVGLSSPVFQCGYNISCNGSNNGQAAATIGGGCLPYSLLWSNGATTYGNGSLTAGTYTLTVTDGNGHVTVQSITLTQPPVALSTTLGPDQTYEFSCTCASLVAATSGGSTCSPYVYAWSTGATSSSITVCPNQSATYSVTVTDINGCVTTDVIQIIKPAVVAQLDRYVLMGTGTGNVSVGNSCSFTDGSIGKRLAAGTLSIGNNTFCNLSVAGNNVVVGNNVIISTLYRNTATIGAGAIISSTVTPLTMPLTAKVPCFPVFSGGANVNVPNNTTMTISPGTYNNVTLGNNSILKLNAGVYNVNSISTFNGSFILPNGTATAKDIMVFVKTSMNVSNNNEIHGSYYAQGAMNLANGNNTTGTFYGAYLGNPVSVGNNLSFFLDSYCFSNLALCTVKMDGDETSIAEPGTFNLFPNPNNGTFTIQYAGATGNEINMSVLNTLGQVVYQRDVYEFTGEIIQEIDLNTLTPGVYFIQVRNGNEFSRKQFIITK